MLLCVSQVYFESEEVCACIVTCGGLCPGLNTVIREIVCGLYHMYGVHKVLGIEVRKCMICHYNQTHSKTRLDLVKDKEKKNRYEENERRMAKLLEHTFVSILSYFTFLSFPSNLLISKKETNTLILLLDSGIRLCFKTEIELDVKRMDDQMVSTKEVSFYI
jgi:hypothetical protein